MQDAQSQKHQVRITTMGTLLYQTAKLRIPLESAFSRDWEDFSAS